MISEPQGAGSAHRDDAATNIAPGPEAIDGHVGQKVRQHFECERVRAVKQKKLKIDAMEFMLRDQFGNKYFLHRAMLFDGDLYDVAQWWWKGGSDGKLVGEFKKFKVVNDALMDFARDQAFLAFGRTNLEIAKHRRLTSNPVILEPKDITHQSAVLARAIEDAGKPKQMEPFDAGKFLTPEKVDTKPVPTNGEAGTVIHLPGIIKPSATPTDGLKKSPPA